LGGARACLQDACLVAKNYLWAVFLPVYKIKHVFVWCEPTDLACFTKRREGTGLLSQIQALGWPLKLMRRVAYHWATCLPINTDKITVCPLALQC